MDKSPSPLVSIVLPMYNAEQYIQECIDSILMQTYTNFELLIIDDGSSDHCAQIAAANTDSRIRLIKNKHDYIGSLNMGLAESQGKYIARMDADDKMKPYRIEKQVIIMEKMPEIALCSGYMQRLNGTEIYNSGIQGLLLGIKPILLIGNFISHPTTMLRKEYLLTHSLKYRRNYPYAEDYKLWEEIAILDGKLFVIPEALIDYRISSTQVSKKYNTIQEESSLKIKNELLSYMLRHDCVQYSTEFKCLYNAFTKLNDKCLINDSSIFWIFFQLFSTIESNNK